MNENEFNIDIKEAIENYKMGDIFWLDYMKEKIGKIYDNEINGTLEMLYALNFIVVEIEDYEYADKKYGKYNIREIYDKMKIDLTKLCGIEEMWEEKLWN